MNNRLSNEAASPPKTRGLNAAILRKSLLLLGLAAVIVFVWRNYADDLTLSGLVAREADIRAFQARNPRLIYGAAFFVYVAVTGLSLPGAVPLTLLFGWFFGFWRAVLLVSCASTTGATVAFLLSRYLLRDGIQKRFADRLSAVNEALEREGAFYLFTLRLIPAVPFFVINVVMGLTPMSVLTYWWVSQLGMLPGTAVYVYAGSQFPDAATLATEGARGVLSPQLIVALILLGSFPLLVRKLFGSRRARHLQKTSGPGSVQPDN